MIPTSLNASSAKEARRFHATREVAENGLLAVGAAFLPLAVHAYGATVDTTWRLASAGFIFLWVLVFAAHMWRRRRVAREGFRTEPIQTALFTVLIASGLGLLLVNTLVGGDTSGARYVTALLLFLAIVGLLFVYATFSGLENHPPSNERPRGSGGAARRRDPPVILIVDRTLRDKRIVRKRTLPASGR